MNSYLIYFWHGKPSEREHGFWLQKVSRLCRKRPEDNTYFWDGTLEEFAAKWGEKFIYLPPETTATGQLEPIMGTICITPHGGFGQR